MPSKSVILEKAVENLLPFLKYKEGTKFNWEKLSESTILKELTLCLLSSNVKYELACLYVSKMESSGLFSKWINIPPKFSELFEILNAPVLFNGKEVRYRFPKSKSKQLSELIYNIYNDKGALKSILRNSTNPINARNMIVTKCCGIGNKQSSMFLRNIGFTNKLAIIDTNIIDYLKQLDIIPSNLNPNTNKKYFQIEQSYFNYAYSKNYNIETLDFAIWSIMRVYKKEFN